MQAKHRQIFYILLAFLAVAILVITGLVANLYLQNPILETFLESGMLVINWTGVTVGLFNIYQALRLKKDTKLWIYIFAVGVVCIGANVYALTV